MKDFRPLFFVLLCLGLATCKQESGNSNLVLSDSDLTAIKEVLTRQESAWNTGNIEEFMEGYWKSDSLQFVGTGITRGWQTTLERYKTSYPDLATMGKLRFQFYRFAPVAPDACLVTGRYTLTREKDSPTGMFTLLLKKISGTWVIVYDHTS